MFCDEFHSITKSDLCRTFSLPLLGFTTLSENVETQTKTQKLTKLLWMSSKKNLKTQITSH